MNSCSFEKIAIKINKKAYLKRKKFTYSDSKIAGFFKACAKTCDDKKFVKASDGFIGYLGGNLNGMNGLSAGNFSTDFMAVYGTVNCCDTDNCNFAWKTKANNVFILVSLLIATFYL